MTKSLMPLASLGKDHLAETRKEMMRLMAEMKFNPANVVPEKQEELASFLVNQLNGYGIDVLPTVNGGDS